ncbi:MAG: hypothetical protein WCF20_12620 [Methylovirgula sp.]
MTHQHGFPVSVQRSKTGMLVTLRAIEAIAFQDHFIEETLRRVHGVETTVPLLAAGLGSSFAKNMSPAGIIFHVSKCGSTLISQLLKHTRQAVIYSQPPALSDLLMPPQDLDIKELVAAVQTLGMLFSRHANGPYILKSESWNVLFCDVLKAAFPDTPWIFCIRDPIEVAVSNMEDDDPPTWYKYLNSDPNPFAVHLKRKLRSDDTPGSYVALFYAEFCDAILRLNQADGKIISYEDLPRAAWEVVAPHFGLRLSEADMRAMTEAAKIYSKSSYGGEFSFMPDAAQKRQRASCDVKSAADRLAKPSFQQLLSQRYAANFAGR